MNGSTMCDEGYSGQGGTLPQVTIQPVWDALPAGIAELAETARIEGYGMLDVLVRDWNEATNRFDQPGEGLFAAQSDGRLIGIAGLNVDPFAERSERAGRVRRLYVHPAARGRGAGRALVKTVVERADGHFDKLTVFAPDAAGKGFYEACGFVRVEGFDRRSHERSLYPPSMLPDVRTKRVWDPFSSDDGARFLVDPRWPPGAQPDSLRIVLWIREVAPSRRLEKWFKKNKSDWDGFCKRYREELAAIRDWEPLVRQARLGPVTLIYASKDRTHNHAVVLATFVAERAST